jgi:hypothetical protein
LFSSFFVEGYLDFGGGDISAIVFKIPLSGEEAPASLTGSVLAVLSLCSLVQSLVDDVGLSSTRS